MRKPELLILAAGMGSRYGGLKQIDPVGPAGETIIDYSIFDAIRAGFGKLVFVIRHDIEQPFRKVVGSRFEQRALVEYVFQELDKLPSGYELPAQRTKPWGTTHAILIAESVIQENFAAINADDFYGRDAYELLAKYLSSGSSDYPMVGFILRNTLSTFGSVARGVCRVGQNDQLQSISEMLKIEPDGTGAKNTDADGKILQLSGEETVSMNFWGFTPALFPQLRVQFEAFLKEHGSEPKCECPISISMNELVVADQAKVRVLRSHDSWFGVTYREERSQVIESILKFIALGQYPEKLWG